MISLTHVQTGLEQDRVCCLDFCDSLRWVMKFQSSLYTHS